MVNGKEKLHSVWTSEDDEKFVQLLLEEAKSGDSIKKIMMNVAPKIGRSAEAVMFRWYGSLSKNYKDLLDEARNQGTPKSGDRNIVSVKAVEVKDNPKLSQYTSELEKVKQFVDSVATIVEENRKLKAQLAAFEKEKEQISLQNKVLEDKVKELNSDLAVYSRAFEKARQITLDEEIGVHSKTKFKMDSNGNLERID